MKTLNSKHVDDVLELINASPYFQLLQMQITEMGMGYARLEMTMSNRHCNPFGGIHGGVYASLIDTTAYWATYCEIDEDSGMTSMDVYANNLSSLQEGKIVVEGRSIKVGRSMCLAEAVVKTESGKILSHGTVKMMVLKGKQSVRNLAKTVEKDLAPKFLDADL